MEQFKALEEVDRIDQGHILLGQITGYVISLPKLHAALADIELHEGVPEDVRGQFNVARNMALYTYFHYALAPEVQMKTYSVIELALKRRFPQMSKRTLSPLLTEAVKHGLLKDSGFRHIPVSDPANGYSLSLVTVLAELRNSAAHGSTNLTPDCIVEVGVCADLVNQLFPRPLPKSEA